MKVVYHRADFDGKASAAAVLRAFPNAELIPYNYGEEFPWESIQNNEYVFMVDISLQPFSLMEELAKTTRLIWIDHHHTAIEDYVKAKAVIAGSRVVGEAACVLTWKYLYPDEPVPLALKYLGLYDIWDHRNPGVLPFQYGLRMQKYTFPDNEELWNKVWRSDPAWISSVISTGNIVLEYQRRNDEIAQKTYAFETEFEGLKALAMNMPGQGSSTFGDMIHDYDLVIKFYRKAGAWRVGLYSVKPDVDCGSMAKKYGGGGHAGAAGFEVKGDLPFNI